MKTRTWGNASRLNGRLLIFVLAVLLVGAPQANATPVRTVVQDTLYRADGSAAQASITIRWDAFSTSAGEAVMSGEMTVATGANGAISIPLIPNSGATPAGGYYRVVIKQNDGTTSEEQWVVGPGATTTLSAIRAKVVPQSVAAQFVSQAYVTEQLDGLATVASTGNYNDLTNKPAAINLAAPGAIGGVTPGVVHATAMTAQSLNVGSTHVAGDGLQAVNARAKGATGNGTSDDTAAITAAFTAAHTLGQCVYFPGGTYLISWTIQFSAPNNCAVGEQGATVLINATFSGPMFQLGTFQASPANAYNDAAQGFVMKNITLENASQTNISYTGSRTTIGIQDNGSGGVELNDVTFHGLEYGFLGAYGSDFDRFYNIVGGFNDVSMYLGPSSQQFSIDAFQTGVDGEGIVIAGAGQGKIANSSFGDDKTSGITFEYRYPTRTGYTLTGQDDASIVVSDSWFETGSGWATGWQEPRQILFQSTGDTSYPRHVRVRDSNFVMGETGLPAMDTTQHSLFEVDSGTYLTFENIIAAGDRYNAIANIEGGAHVLVHNYKSLDGYPQNIPPFYLGTGVNAYNGYIFQNDPNFGSPTALTPNVMGWLTSTPAAPPYNFSQSYANSADGRFYYMSGYDGGAAHKVVFADDLNVPASAPLVGTNSSNQLVSVTSLPSTAEPAHTGDVTNTAGSLAMTVKGLNGVPLCTGFTPLTGQALVYTTASTPNPCYTAATAGAVASVFTRTGAVTAQIGDYTYSQIGGTPVLSGGTTSDLLRYIGAKCQQGAAGLGFSGPVATSPTAICDSNAVNGAVFAAAEYTATGQSVQDHFTLPATWTGNIDIAGVFRSVGASGNVVWAIQTGCVGSGAIFDPVFNTKNSITVAAQGTTLWMNSFTQTGITVTGCAAGNELFWKLTLDAASTEVGNVDLTNVTFTVRRTL